MTKRLDPDAITDQLVAIADELLDDQRTISLAWKLDEVRREIGRALTEIDPVRRRGAPLADIGFAAQPVGQGAESFGPITARRVAL